MNFRVFNSRDGKFNISFFLNGIICVIRIYIFSFARIRVLFIYFFATMLIIPIVFRAKVNGKKWKEFDDISFNP